MSDVRSSVIKTIVYADIFNYLLTKEETHKFLISSEKHSQKDVNKALLDFDSKDGYYYIKGRGLLVNIRKRREKESLEKIKLAKGIAFILSIIPSILLIGVSGNLAMSNAEKKDDIDFFIISTKETIWTTRLLVILVLKIIGKYRGKFDKQVSNKICVNMLIDDAALEFSNNMKNLYTAHEIVQMIPLFDRNSTYKRFISKNKWVEKFLSNSIDNRILRDKDIKSNQKSQPSILISKYLNIFELMAKKFQLWYMKENRSTEFISETILAFHPKDYKKKVLKLYGERLKKYGV